MKILVVTSGSSTIKYQLFDGMVEKVHAKGIGARIAEQGSYIKQETPNATFRLETPVPNYHSALELLVEALLDPDHGAVRDISEVSAIGHRAVHGADLFIESTLITPDVITKMEEYVPLAPLHNPPNLMAIREAQKLFSDVPQVAVFDTSFHQTMPPKAFLCAIPLEYYTGHKIRCEGLGYLGLWIDEEVNNRTRAVDAVISRPGSRAKALVIATDEEKMIALDTREIVGGLAGS